MNQLTDKNYCVMLMGGYKTYLNENEFNIFKVAMKSGVKFVEVGEKMINISSVVLATHASEIEKTEKEKRGDWQCEHGEWHKRGEECAHGYKKQIDSSL